MRNINKVIAVGFSLAFTSFNCFSQKTSLKEKKSLKDFFLPMPVNHKLADKGIWGNANVLPRDTTNGLEDSKLEKWCYWDGDIVKGSDNKYHLYASRWGQEFPHSTGWTKDSKGVHAVSDFITGPYVDKGVVWPDWNKGKGHNVGGLKMKDGRYAIVTSEITEGEIFVSDNPNGPFKFHGKIEVDNNGFKRDLARYNFNGHMSNVKIILRHDGRYMIVARSTAVMISDSGILGPYKIMSDRVYKKYNVTYSVVIEEFDSEKGGWGPYTADDVQVTTLRLQCRVCEGMSQEPVTK